MNPTCIFFFMALQIPDKASEEVAAPVFKLARCTDYTATVFSPLFYPDLYMGEFFFSNTFCHLFLFFSWEGRGRFLTKARSTINSRIQ